MQQTENSQHESTNFEDRLGALVAFAGASFVVASIVLSSTTMSGCGPCWPGPCADASPTTSATPTPTPTGEADVSCTVSRDRDLIDANLWQGDSETCPQILLDPAGAAYAGGEFCETGLRMDGATDVFLFRYACNVSEPWELAIATASDDSDTMEVLRICPTTVPQSDVFVNAEVLEIRIWDRRQDDIKAEAAAWTEGCVAEDASEDRLTQCAAVCAGTQSLYGALEALDELPEDAEVGCYLKLYDAPAPPDGTTVASTDDSVSVNSSCLCAPTTAFLDCLVDADGTGETCFTDTETYDVNCGETCWIDHGTESDACPTPVP